MFEKLMTPLEDAALGLGVSITATSGSANKEVERQGYMTLLQLASGLYPQFIQAVQLGMQGAGTPIGEVALQSARGLQELFQRLLEQYDIRNPEEILPLSQQTADAATQQGLAVQAAAGMVGGPSQGAGGNGVDPSMAALFSGAGSGL